MISKTGGLNFLFVMAIFISCNSSHVKIEGKPVEIEADEPTKRMILKVAGAVSLIDLDNVPFILNNKKADLLYQNIKSSSGNQRISLLFSYGLELMNSGKNNESITVFNQVLDLLMATSSSNKEMIVFSVKKQLAIAYIRKAEQENCIINHNAESCIIPISKKAQHILTSGSEKAIKILNELLIIRPNDYECQYLLNIAHMTLGQYPSYVPIQYRIPEEYFTDSIQFPKFHDVAMNLGVAVNEKSGGTCIDDFNNDGYLDIIASSWGFDDQIKYFENDKSGGFTDKTSSTGLLGVTGGLNLRHADYNNDGFLDFIILRGAWLRKQGEIPNSLIRNNGDGTFTDVTIEAGLFSLHPTQTAVWGDFNLDGWVDIFIANESLPGNKNKCELFLNNTDGTFTDVAQDANISQLGYFKGVASGDLNNDMYPDIYLSNYSGENTLYMNVSQDADHLSFKRVDSKEIAKPIRSFSTWIFDYNNDGQEDIFVSGYSVDDKSPTYLLIDNIKTGRSNNRPLLYKNNGDGTFTDVSLDVNLTEPITTMGCNFGDLDNDGFLDFYLATGDPDFSSIVPNRMFRNNNGETFQDVTYNGGFGHIQKGHAIGFGDLDMDGDQDIYAVMGGAYDGDIFQNLLFENPDGNKNNWINILLEGNTSNRSAIGAKLIILIEEQGKARKIYLSVGTDASFGGNSLLAEIGLGKAEIIKTLKIKWPNKMKSTSIFHNIKINQIIRIKENSDEIEIMNLKSVSFNTEFKSHHH